jgi:thymidine kinase
MAEMILYTGPMFSSKTTKLLMQADKRHYQKQNIIAFKSKMDDRYSDKGEIVTHNFNKLEAHLVNTGKEIIEIMQKHDMGADFYDCIIIDELFLIEGSAKECIDLFKMGYDIVIASIDLNFLGEPFKEIQKIMPYCTEIVKCKAVCTVCQKDARYTFKKQQYSLSNANKKIQVGGSELYEPRCQEHHSYMRH